VAYSNLVALLVAVIFGIFALSEPLPQTAYAPAPPPPARPTRAGLTPRGGGAGGREGLAGRGLSLLGMVLGSVALSGAGDAPPAPPGKAARAATRKLPIAQYEMGALDVAHPRPVAPCPPTPARARVPAAAAAAAVSAASAAGVVSDADGGGGCGQVGGHVGRGGGALTHHVRADSVEYRDALRDVLLEAGAGREAAELLDHKKV